ncbi:MAG TPA: glycosyl hydrolase [Pseudonocardiaceae bacterium]|nr:glycosyl hydrolase [Pseudonocardiaceae bacterium]
MSRAAAAAGAVALAAALLLLTVGGWAERLGSSSAPPTRSMAGPSVPLGAFLGSDQSGVDRIPRFASATGATVSAGRTYLPGRSWADVEGPDWAIDPWSAWRAAQPDRMLVVNVPMVVPNEPPLADVEAAALLRRGAQGRFDAHFRRLAERLVERRAGDTVIVLGWEMNGTTYSGRCAPDPAAWKQYWRKIVAAMRAVPDQRFRFDFAPARGAQAVPWPQCYPGDDVVDIIGMDSYDQAPGRTFRDFVEQPYGLQAHADFAAAHGKPVSFPEWGLYDHGDNPAYVRAMHDWFSTHDVAYQSVTDYCPHGVWGCTANPESSRAYRELFGGSGQR